MAKERGEAARQLPTRRLEALIDGVFAIAITLLVIEIEVPDVESRHSSDLADALLELWPSYLAYAVTFFLVGAYWVNHHRMFFLLRGIDHTFLILNILCLMAIAIIPFPNAVVAGYLTHPDLRGVAAGVYGIAMLILATLYTVTWWYAYHRGLFKPEVDKAKVKRVLHTYSASIVIFSGGIILSRWSPLAALILFMLLPLAYLFEGPVASIDEGYLGPGE